MVSCLITAYLSQSKPFPQPNSNRYLRWGYRILLLGLATLLFNILILYLLVFRVIVPYVEKGGSLDHLLSTWTFRPVPQDVGHALLSTWHTRIIEDPPPVTHRDVIHL